jgi:hypothetical protein
MSFSIIQKAAYSKYIYVLFIFNHTSLIHGLEHRSQTTKGILIQVILEVLWLRFGTAILTNESSLIWPIWTPSRGGSPSEAG